MKTSPQYFSLRNNSTLLFFFVHFLGSFALYATALESSTKENHPPLPLIITSLEPSSHTPSTPLEKKLLKELTPLTNLLQEEYPYLTLHFSKTPPKKNNPTKKNPPLKHTSPPQSLSFFITLAKKHATIKKQLS